MKCFLLNDQSERRESLKALLRQIDRRTQFAEAKDWQQTNWTLKHDVPDLFVIDWQRHWMHTTELLRLLHIYPNLPVAVFTDDTTRGTVETLLSAGVLGIIPRTLEPHLILRALQLVLLGGHYIPVCFLNLNLPKKGRRSDHHLRFIQAQEQQPNGLQMQLSPRQHQIMRFLHMGSTNKSIARALNISEGTVKIHLATIFRVLGAANRAAAVALYNGWQTSKLKVLDHETSVYMPNSILNLSSPVPFRPDKMGVRPISQSSLIATQATLPYSDSKRREKNPKIQTAYPRSKPVAIDQRRKKP